MKKWKYENEINTATKVLLAAYLATMHSTTIAVVFDDGDAVYYHDLTDAEIADLARVATDDKKATVQLKTQKLSAGRKKQYLANAVKICSTADREAMQNEFPSYNNGFISEFLYRHYVTNEPIAEIKKANNSIAYDMGSDTKDNKQIKDITKGATFTTLKYLKEVCEKNSYNTTEVNEQIEIITKIMAE